MRRSASAWAMAMAICVGGRSTCGSAGDRALMLMRKALRASRRRAVLRGGCQKGRPPPCHREGWAGGAPSARQSARRAAVVAGGRRGRGTGVGGGGPATVPTAGRPSEKAGGPWERLASPCPSMGCWPSMGCAGLGLPQARRGQHKRHGERRPRRRTCPPSDRGSERPLDSNEGGGSGGSPESLLRSVHVSL